MLVEGTEQAMEKDFSEVLGGITRGEMGKRSRSNVEKLSEEVMKGSESGGIREDMLRLASA